MAKIDRDEKRNERIMRCTLMAIAAFEGFLGLLYVVVGIVVYAVSPPEFLAAYYAGLSPGAAAFLTAFITLCVFAAVTRSIVRRTFFDRVTPARLRSSMPQCRVLGLLMLAILTQSVFMAWGLAVVLEAFSDYADAVSYTHLTLPTIYSV